MTNLQKKSTKSPLKIARRPLQQIRPKILSMQSSSLVNEMTSSDVSFFGSTGMVLDGSYNSIKTTNKPRNTPIKRINNNANLVNNNGVLSLSTNNVGVNTDDAAYLAGFKIKQKAKPTYAFMIATAIINSSTKILRLSEIYEYIEANFLDVINRTKDGWQVI